MPKLSRGTFQLHYEDSGGPGEPVVFVHGCWGDHHQWDEAAARMAGSFCLLAYDRRGHGSSTVSGELVGLSDHVADLSELIAIVARGPAHLISNGVGATIALQLALQRPDQVRGVNLHEPPLVGLLEGDPASTEMYRAYRELESAVEARFQARDPGGAAQLYIGATSSEAGSWDRLTESVRRSFVASAPSALRELGDLALQYMDLTPFATYREPIVITGGATSAGVFGAVNERLAAGFYAPLRYTYAGAGHLPHVSLPEEFGRVAVEFGRFTSQKSPK